MNLGNLFAGVSALGILATGLWWGAVEYDSVQDRLSAMEARLGDYDTLSEPEGATEVARRLNKLEAQVSSLTSVSAVIETRVDGIDATTGGATSELGQRVTRLEENVAALAQRKQVSTEPSQKVESVNVLSPSQPSAAQAYDRRVPTAQSVGPFAVSLERCSKRGTSLECFGNLNYSGPARQVWLDKCVLKDQSNQTWLPSEYSLAGDTVLDEVIKSSVRPNIAAGDHQIIISFKDLVMTNSYTLQCRIDRKYTVSFDNILER
ncbi:hypothetical protein RYZ27_04230 [Hyphomonas sp. FCG-A18]|uniref:hypothetical protein n=1 Tax=Hyphomonas sp. FCG-A18 TaxID=3080019 RepID=UPI002B3200B5|nr:hypothetical protein RYZ27_04230 [Hyphomonas sp. FCG-A18]